jgi:Protein of unknown function (DUF2490)
MNSYLERPYGIRCFLIFLVLLLFQSLRAQAQTLQFLPEVDAYVKLQPEIQVYFQAKETREGGDPTQAEIGPSLQFYLKPWIKLKNATIFDLNEASKRPLVFAVGYRYLPSPYTATVNRLRLDITPHLPMRGKILITDRNRADLDWQSGKFMWRYRNKLTVQRRFTIHSYHPAPYVAAEAFYESEYQKWSTTALYAGCLLPILKRAQIEPYYEHQNNTGKSPNQKLNQLGLVLGLFP